ncbi:MAG: hypothetical protein E2P02_22975 [Acidobacteria bacterium]|nr:MAG: hypothetical protein E2P02_22975 [Acidobacteriota bacterium]
MKIVRLIPVLCLLVLASGCLMSEQIGEPIGQGRTARPNDDVTIHFDTTFNRIVIFGRSALMVAFAVWVFTSFGAKPGSIIVGGAALAVSGWLFIQDYRALKGYSLEVAAPGLTLRVPGELNAEIPWESVEGIELEGFNYARISGGMQFSPTGGMTKRAGLELPDWKTMRVMVAGGTTHLIKLEELSIEHRQIFAKALIKRANLVEE